MRTRGADCVVYNAFPYYANEDGEMEYYYYDNPTGVSELSGLKSYLLFEGEDTSSNDQFLIDASVNGSSLRASWRRRAVGCWLSVPS